jgi:uncharacterized membrane-anchored protein YhcB (DUF1043 family)
MNQIKKSLLLAALLLLFSVKCSLSQETDRPYDGKGTVETQFNFVFDKSYTFEVYKSIRIPWFQSLKAHVLDTLKTLKKDLKTNQIVIQKKDSELDSLKKELTATKQDLETSTREKNSFRLLGVLMSKSAYNSLVWLIILGLSVLLGILLLLFKRNSYVTVQTKKDLTELKDEFESFRKRSLEREEKMARKHLDELNKYKK